MNGLKRLEEPSLKIIFFGGKGGVGKTTCACGTALHLADTFKTLVFSTDPAHSLADSLGQTIGDQLKKVEGIANLSALEVNAEKALVKFMTEHSDQIRHILDSSTYLDAEDIDAILSLPIPGMDEVMGLKAMADLIDDGTFEKYVVDTAPTGHALRLLSSPKLLDDWIKVMAKMRWKYRYVVEALAGEYQGDETDDFLLAMKKAVKRTQKLFVNPDQCEFIAVTVPEDLAVSETERLINSLNQRGIRVRHLIINNVMEPRDCVFCREKGTMHEAYIRRIEKKFGAIQITIVPSQPSEIKGLEALADFKMHLFD